MKSKYKNNIMFDRYQTVMEVRDNLFDKYYELYDRFVTEGFNVATDDVNNIYDSEVVIYKEMPSKLPIKQDINKSYLIMMESPLVKPDNFDSEKHKRFRKIFTWDDSLVDNEKSWPQLFKQTLSIYKLIPVILLSCFF